MNDELATPNSLAIRKHRYQELAPIYARIARMVADDFVRLKGMSVEDAETAAVAMLLDQARDTLIGMEEIDEAINERKRQPAPVREG